MNTILIWLLSILVAVTFQLLLSIQAMALEPAVKRMVLAGDWPGVVTELEQKEANSNDTVLTLLMGHATLATNRNNVSYVLFLSKQTLEALDTWVQWTRQFSQAYPKSAVAHYLAGDAEARLGHLDAAIARFTKSLAINPEFALAVNARGVAAALSGDIDFALVAFFQARQFNPSLADAHANFGTLAVFREFSISQGQEALSAFNKAISINPDFALAYNGRGSLFFGSGEFEQAVQDFQKARNVAPYLLAADLNGGFAYTFANAAVTLESIEENPGTTLSAEVYNQVTQLANVTPTPILDAIAKYRSDQAGSSKDMLAKGVINAEFHKGITNFPQSSVSFQKAFIDKFGRTAVVMGLANERERLQFHIMDRNIENQGLVSQQPDLIRNRLSLVRRQVVYDLSTTGAGIVLAGATAPAAGVTAAVGTATAVGLGKVSLGEISSRIGHPNLAKVIQDAPDSASIPANVLGSLASLRNLDRSIKITTLSNKLDRLNYQWDTNSADNRLDQVKINGLNRVLSQLNNQPSHTALAPADNSPLIGFQSDNGIPWLQIKTQLSNQFGGLSNLRDQQVGIMSMTGTRGFSISNRVLQAKLNEIGVVAPIIPNVSNVVETAKQLKVNVIVATPTFPILQTNLQAHKSFSSKPTLGGGPDQPTQRDDRYKDPNPMPGINPPHFPPPPPPPPPPVILSDTSIRWNPITPINKVNGVLTKTNAFVDRGGWPVLTGFGLAYKSKR